MSAPVGGGRPEGWLALETRPFSFQLPRPLQTSSGLLASKRGWLLRLQGPDGSIGWGEAAPLDPGERPAVAAALAALGPAVERSDLERRLPALPPALAFALGAALAESDGIVGVAADGGWLAAPPPAWLLPAGEAMLADLVLLQGAAAAAPLTVKWKVAAAADGLERQWLERLLERLPADGRLRLDANGGWDRTTAAAWAGRLARESRLEWLEQPLAAGDQKGLEQLALGIPVALDESLRQRPELRHHWGGWQVRRPSQDGDPRPLLGQLLRGVPRLMLSTGFETGIGARWTAHLAALQWRGPTPVAPGLAPDWSPSGSLFERDPQRVWAAAA
ncbi:MULTISPECIES: o-succinylbenzoate synthase [unclassified Cyanobium]|uniref:o-succinylbenzoate synthase n=1 Tax=unclassified Cyanobium TaxID=2627006 RepID=UPI0020CB9B78|nr:MULTISPECIES: o-succinylbenzoate synthase [unclassified Cyanobium]